MRFEVEVDDGNNLDALHKARLAEADPSPDMPSYIQRLIDKSVQQVLAPLGPTTLQGALTKIAELEAKVASLTPAVVQAQPG